MRIYFITAERAALKLDGEYAGITDLFERHAECDLSRPTAVEIIPDDDLRPLNFFIDDAALDCCRGGRIRLCRLHLR